MVAIATGTSAKCSFAEPGDPGSLPAVVLQQGGDRHPYGESRARQKPAGQSAVRGGL